MLVSVLLVEDLTPVDHDYKLFTVNGLDENYGGIGTIGYRLDNTLLEGRVPGNFNSTLSMGRNVPGKYFPKFI